MGLDIEHLFGLESAAEPNRCSVGSGAPGRRRSRERPRKGASETMAMQRVDPVEVHVRTDWFDGRPTEISWGERRLPVTRLVAVRDETAAFPVILGPRTVFEVQTPVARFTLSYRHRTRRWTVDGLDELARAA